MTRDDVIDVLSVVAAATRRTVGETDVDVWQAVIGELPKDLSLRAVRDHLRERPGVWLEPGHIHERVRAIRREQLEREPDEMREARQAALDARFGATVGLELPGSTEESRQPRTPGSAPVNVGNALNVACPWCKATLGHPCVIPGSRTLLKRTRFHESREEAALAKFGEPAR